MTANAQNTPLFVTGIGTDVGKTLVSAILVQALGRDYWKPIQAGDLDQSDTMRVQNLVIRNDYVAHQEYARLTKPVSPHLAAAHDGVTISLNDIRLPQSSRGLVVEGAGGLLVPLNDDVTMIDFVEKIRAEVVIVSRNYLGSINHSLLTFEVLKQRGIKIAGWIFNGYNKEGEHFIAKKTATPGLLSLLPEPAVTPEIVQKYAKALAANPSLPWKADIPDG